MKWVEKPTEDRPSGLSRRQLFCRLAGGYAGALLASLGWDEGRKAAAAPGPISVRDLLRRISDKGCDPSRGIRVGLPNDHPVISLRAVAGRYATRVVNFCQPLQFFGREEQLAVGVRLSLVGTNFTGGGRAAIQYWSDLPSDRFDFSVPVRPDGTFARAMDLPCNSAGKALYSLRATDVATGRSADGPSGSYICAEPPPPPPPPPPKPPSINVSQQGFTFNVRGSGFLASHVVHVRVVSNAPGAPPNGLFFSYTSDSSGGISAGINIPCVQGIQLYFSANDERPNAQDTTGTLWSNTVLLTCS